MALLLLSVIFVGGMLFMSQNDSVAQAPPTATAPIPDKAPPEAAAAPAPAVQAQPTLAPAAAPEPQPAPVVTAPAAPETTPAPVVSAPPADTTAPVVTAPAETAPSTVVTAPPLPPIKPPMSEGERIKSVAAKFLFAAKQLPSLGKALAIGYYPRGCLQGGIELPTDGPTWEVMRLSRNRNWGHPELIQFLKTFAPAAAKATGWHGILIGDMAQPRGGPLPFGHLSHQIGLDVDIWFMPKPDRTLTKEERENISAFSLVAKDGKHVNENWTPAHIAFIRTAAEMPNVERVLVNAAIKKKLCEIEGSTPHSWMDKVRPWYGHDDHIHVRLKCPADSPNCRAQPSVPGGDGCGKELTYWFSEKVLHPKPSPAPSAPKKGLMMADLPPACKEVLAAPAKPGSQAADSSR
ncbi:MAG TPA: penicillin-insensitive murein endopeptidase [Pseudolabrys sp.]|nr:penicillin-insensitive murein endopeptidase [Pseudolabrys sp.]